jgi:hypothetical protein
MNPNNSNHSTGLTTEQPVAPGFLNPATQQGTPANLDESEPIVTSKMGVHLAEQQQVVVRKAVDGNVRPMTARADAHLREPDWDLQKMLLRENLVSSFAWALTDTPGSELSIASTGSTPTDVPQDLLRNEIVSAPFQRFQWCRFDRCHVRFQITASRFHQGRLLVYFVPTMLPKHNLVTASAYHPTRATQIQHGFLDPSNGTVLDMDIPFRFNKGFIDLIFGDVLGQLRVQVLNQLQAATGASTSVEIKVFVSFEGAHFRVPRPGGVGFSDGVVLRRQIAQLEQEKRDFEAELSRLKLSSKRNKELEDVVLIPRPTSLPVPIQFKGAPDAANKPAKSGLLSYIYATEQSGLGEHLGRKLDQIVESVVPAEVTGAIAGILLDKPAFTEYPEPLVHKDAQYMSASRGVEKLERMTLEPTAQYLTMDQFGDNVDEMDMKHILKKPTYLTSFNWASTDNVGTVLYSSTTSPMHLASGEDTAATFNPTPYGFFGNLFTYWRGGLVFIFQVVGTAFHEGRLDFCNHPGTTTVPTDYPTAMSQYAASQTVRNTNNTIEVRIPYHSDIPWKRTWMGEHLSDVETDGAVRSMDYVIGCFSVRVAVPLKNPNNVANNVDVNVFVCAADDFEYHTLSLVGGIWSPAMSTLMQKKRKNTTQFRAPQKQVRAVEQSGDLNTDSKDDSGIICLGVGDVYTSDYGAAHHFGETYSNLREMCKRYTWNWFDSFSLSGGAGNLGSVQFAPFNMGGLPQYLATAYRLFRGPLNGKMQMEVDAPSGQIPPRVTGFMTNNPQPAVATDFSLAGLDQILSASGRPVFPARPNQVPLIRFSSEQIAEYQVPFQSIYHSLIMDNFDDDYPEYYANMFARWDLPWCISTSTTSSPTVQLTNAIAFGDETRFGVFLGCPPMAPNSAIYPNPGS